MRRVVAIVGATATGKTALADAVAAALGGEIVCADARQVFRELEIGTGKPDPAARARRPHHLFDVLGLGQHASAGWYARAAAEACEVVLARDRVPVLVGGSGLYLRALQRGLSGAPPRDPAVRAGLEAEAEASGIESLHDRLRRSDPESAARLAPRDRQRIVRALEVEAVSGRPMSWWRAGAHEPALPADWRVIELTCAPEALDARIATRTRTMLAAGLVEETRALLEAGHGAALAALRAIGYDEAAEHVAGRLGLAETAAAIDRRTRQLAKRQRTWFRHQVEAVRIASDAPDAAAALERALAAVD